MEKRRTGKRVKIWKEFERKKGRREGQDEKGGLYNVEGGKGVWKSVKTNRRRDNRRKG
jgi:hypothetical protein